MGKEHFFRDHSELFRPEDIKIIPYYYAGENGDIIIEEKEGLSRKLSAMKDRLELLGYTMDDVWGMYDALAKEYSDAPFYEALSFDVFAKLLEEIDIKKSTLYTSQCPYNAKYVPVLEGIAAEKAIPFRAIHLDSRQAAQSAPTPVTTYALFLDGNYLTNEQMNDKRFLKLLEKQ